jgi:hypothetical protein
MLPLAGSLAAFLVGRLFDTTRERQTQNLPAFPCTRRAVELAQTRVTTR